MKFLFQTAFLAATVALPLVARAQPVPATTDAVALPQGDPVIPREEQKAIQDAIPLTPNMILELQHRYGDAQKAQEEGMQELAFPVSRMVNVTLAPGEATNIVQTVRGYPTALSFFDATGQPWPIGWNTSSNASNVNGGTNCNSSSQTSGGGSPAVNAVGFYVCVPVKGSNVIEITPMSSVPRGGLVVELENAPKPLSFLLIAGRGRYDADLSVHVSSRGPNAKALIDTRPGTPVTGAPYLTSMLDGVAPADAKPLSVQGVSPDEVRAWQLGNETYIRTRYTLMSPAWDASESGAGGTTIYAIHSTPYVLMSADDRTVSVGLTEEQH